MLVNQQPYQLPPHYPPASTRKLFGAIARTSPRSLVASVDAERDPNCYDCFRRKFLNEQKAAKSGRAKRAGPRRVYLTSPDTSPY